MARKSRKSSSNLDIIVKYKQINDDINTLQIRFRANKRQYIMRCSKEYRSDIAAILRKHNVREQKMK